MCRLPLEGLRTVPQSKPGLGSQPAQAYDDEFLQYTYKVGGHLLGGTHPFGTERKSVLMICSLAIIAGPAVLRSASSRTFVFMP